VFEAGFGEMAVAWVPDVFPDGDTAKMAMWVLPVP
jgi:hypothetical protein